MKCKFSCFYFLVILLTVSCEKEVTIDFNQEPKLCLNCVLNPDSIITARVTASRGIETSFDFENIDDATILLYENNEFLGELTAEGNGSYSLNVKPISNNEYQIEITHPDYPGGAASTQIPRPPIVAYRFESLPEYEVWVNAFFEIQDPKSTANYYWLKPFDTNAPFIDNFNRSLDTDSKYGYVYDYYMRISDAGYDGETLSLNTIAIKGRERKFWAVDTHYDKYLKSSLKVQLNKESELPFQEPMQIYSNIKNGYGIFGSCATTTIKQ